MYIAAARICDPVVLFIYFDDSLRVGVHVPRGLFRNARRSLKVAASKLSIHYLTIMPNTLKL